MGPEKSQGSGSRVVVWLGRVVPGSPFGGGRVGTLGLGGAEGHLDLRVEVDLLGKGEDAFPLLGDWQ